MLPYAVALIVLSMVYHIFLFYFRMDSRMLSQEGINEVLFENEGD